MLRRTIQYLRSCFCNHKWELVLQTRTWEHDTDRRPIGCEKVYMCAKCGHIQRIKSTDL